MCVFVFASKSTRFRSFSNGAVSVNQVKERERATVFIAPIDGYAAHSATRRMEDIRHIPRDIHGNISPEFLNVGRDARQSINAIDDAVLFDEFCAAFQNHWNWKDKK